MAIGCSHGNRANRDALAAALLFREQYKPDEVIHLGDAYDLASLRAGSLANPDDSDHADDYLDDIECGREFLNALRPTVFILGNHDQRALKYLHHHNTVVRGFAEAIWDKMKQPIEKHARVFHADNYVDLRAYAAFAEHAQEHPGEPYVPEK
jgi:predicted phosphodiesterase